MKAILKKAKSKLEKVFGGYQFTLIRTEKIRERLQWPPILRDDATTSTSSCNVLIYVTCPDVGLFFIAKVGDPCLRVTVEIKSVCICISKWKYSFQVTGDWFVYLDDVFTIDIAMIKPSCFCNNEQFGVLVFVGRRLASVISRNCR